MLTITLESVETRYELAGFKLPSTWQERMEAVINGAVDYDDALDLARLCAVTADQRPEADMSPPDPFYEVDYWILDLNVPEQHESAAENLLKLAQLADQATCRNPRYESDEPCPICGENDHYLGCGDD